MSMGMQDYKSFHIILFVGTKEVLYSGNDYSAKKEVNALIRSLGFTPVDRGSLSNAIEIEDIPVQRFPQWKSPSIVSLIVFIFLFLIIFGSFNICRILNPRQHPPPPGSTTPKPEIHEWDWDLFWDHFAMIPAKIINVVLAMHALTMLALCYLPGCIAAYIQLWRGTKYSRFPNFLDKWLKMRKQLGLLMLFSASMHVRNIQVFG